MGPTAATPVAPGRLGEAIDAAELLTYLDGLRRWVDGRRSELDMIDQAALATAEPDLYSTDVVLAMSLWQSISGRHAEMVARWDSGRVGVVERRDLSRLIWARMDGSDGSAGLSPVEAVRLCDALVAQLRIRLSFDPDAAGVATRITTVRAEIERARELATEPSDGSAVRRLRDRLDELAVRVERGADVTGPLGLLAADVARTERDLIVGASERRHLARDHDQAQAHLTRLGAREHVVRELVARCRAEVATPPRLAVPDVERLGAAPTDRDGLNAFLERLAAVERALDVVETAYGAPLKERAELRGRLDAYRAMAEANGRSASATVMAGYEEARAAVDRVPCDVEAAGRLVVQYQSLARELGTGGSTR